MMKQHNKFSCKEMLVLLTLTAFFLLPFLLLRLSPAFRFRLSHSSFSLRVGYRLSVIPASIKAKETKELQRILKGAAMQDKTVIITTLNQAWASQNTMIDLFMESFRVGEGTSKYLNHLIIVALDQKAYDRCVLLHIHCYSLKTNGVDFTGEKGFMTEDYLHMMWRRIEFLREVLEAGYNVLFTDADIVWLRDPFLYLSQDADFQIACDRFVGYSKSLRNRPNGGFVFAQSNKRTIEFYKYWYMSREVYPNKHDQDVLNKIKYDEALAKIAVKIRFLDTTYFAGFCEGGKDMERVCTMHANCCVGLDSKLHDLRLVLSDWKKYKSMTPQEKKVSGVFWNAPKKCTL